MIRCRTTRRRHAPRGARRRAGRPRSRALALVEVIVSIGILGGLMVAVLTAVGAAAVSRSKTMERIQGSALAERLMGEILASKFQGATPPPPLVTAQINILGITVNVTTPSADPSRSSFDSVDDYHGWSASPPLARDGTVIPGYTGWAQSVLVEYVPPTGPNAAASGTPTNLRRITVVITRDGREICRMMALRSSAWEALLDAR